MLLLTSSIVKESFVKVPYLCPTVCCFNNKDENIYKSEIQEIRPNIHYIEIIRPDSRQFNLLY